MSYNYALISIAEAAKAASFATVSSELALLIMISIFHICEGQAWLVDSLPDELTANSI